MLNSLRESLRPYLERLGRAFASTGVSPDSWTVLGLVLAFAAAVSYGLEYAYALAIGGILLLVSGFFDVVDGQVARATGKTSRRGAFLDSVFDKVAEVAIFLGLMIGGYAEPYLVFLAVSLSLLVSYTRSRAESLGIKLEGIGIGERAERLLVIAIGSIAGYVEYAIVIVVVIAGITFVHRVIVAARNLS